MVKLTLALLTIGVKTLCKPALLVLICLMLVVSPVVAAQNQSSQGRTIQWIELEVPLIKGKATHTREEKTQQAVQEETPVQTVPRQSDALARLNQLYGWNRSVYKTPRQTPVQDVSRPSQGRLGQVVGDPSLKGRAEHQAGTCLQAKVQCDIFADIEAVEAAIRQCTKTRPTLYDNNARYTRFKAMCRPRDFGHGTNDIICIDPDSILGDPSKSVIYRMVVLKRNDSIESALRIPEYELEQKIQYADGLYVANCQRKFTFASSLRLVNVNKQVIYNSNDKNCFYCPTDLEPDISPIIQQDIARHVCRYAKPVAWRNAQSMQGKAQEDAFAHNQSILQKLGITPIGGDRVTSTSGLSRPSVGAN